MTSIHKPTLLAVAAAVCTAAAPVKAAPGAQEVFATLAQREAPAEMQPARRAAAVPALALLPAEADAVFAAANAGESALALTRLRDCGCKVDEAQLASIGSAAMSAGGGSSAAFERALPALVYAMQLASLEEWEARWCEHARPELVEAIHRGFSSQLQYTRRNLQAVLADCHLRPVYAALTAQPGREAEFRNLCRSVQQAMRRAAEKGAGRWVEQAGYTAALCASQLHLWKLLTGREPDSADLREHLAQREVWLLAREQENSLLLALCERVQDVALPPQSAEASLLTTPLLSGADAHIEQLRAAAWVSPEYFRALQRCLLAEKNPLMLALADSFRALGQAAPKDQGLYTQAVEAALSLAALPPQDATPRITHPMQMQLWQPAPDTLRAHASMDAWGARFEPGELRLTNCATHPGTIYYIETTAFTTPYIPPHEGRCKSLLNVGQALLLSLREDSRDSLTPLLHGAALLAPEAVALEGALRTMGSALGAPLALVSGDTAPGEDPAVALCAAVKTRAGLAEGWRQMLSALGRAAGKLGLPETLLTELPVASREPAPGITEHALHLPFLPKGMHPSVALSDSYWALGYSPALNQRLLAQAASGAGRMAYSGAVSAFSFPGWAKTARTMTDRAGDKPGKALSITRFLERLAQKAILLLHATTIQNGAYECGTVVKLKE